MVFATGNNDRGQLGLGDNFVGGSEPSLISSLLDYKITDIFTGKNHNIVYGTLRDATKVVNKAAAQSNSGAKGEFIFSWGDNSYGQLGLDKSRRKLAVPTLITTFDGINNDDEPEIKNQIVGIVGGLNNAFVLFSDGLLFGFGNNTAKQISIEDTRAFMKPHLMEYPFVSERGAKIVDFMASANSLLAVTDQNFMILQGQITEGEIKVINIDYYGEDVMPYLCDNRLVFFFYNRLNRQVFKNKIELYKPKVGEDNKNDKSQDTSVKNDKKGPILQPSKSQKFSDKMVDQTHSSGSSLNTSINSNKNSNTGSKETLSHSNSKSFFRTQLEENNSKKMAIKPPISISLLNIPKSGSHKEKSEKNESNSAKKSPIAEEEKKVIKEPKEEKKEEKFEEKKDIAFKKKAFSSKNNDRYKDFEPKNEKEVSSFEQNNSSKIVSSEPLNQKKNKTLSETEISSNLRSKNIKITKKEKESDDGLINLETNNSIIDEIFKDMDFMSSSQRANSDRKFNKKIREDTSVYKSLIKNWSLYKKDPSIKNLFYNGIPSEYRTKLWLLTIKNKFCVTKDYFDIQLSKIQEENKKYDIELPFKYLGLFRKESPLSSDLQDIISALLFSRPDLKYNNSLSNLTGILLINLDKFQSFASLVNIVLNRNLLCFYLDDKKNINKEKEIGERVQIFRQIFFFNLPELCGFMESNEIFPQDYFIEWSMSLFSSCFNIDLVMRIWDVYFAEGFKAVYLASIAILKYFQNRIVNLDFEDILEILHNCQEVHLEEDEIIDNMRHVRIPKWVYEQIQKIDYY